MYTNVLITGGAGYCGSVLVPQLLDDGYKVTVYDIMYFGDAHLPKDHSNLTILTGDIRDPPLRRADPRETRRAH